MADYNSSLPVRIADPNTPANNVAVDSSGKITVKLDDSAGNGITSTTEGAKQALDVNIAGGTLVVGVEDESAFTLGTSIEVPVGGVFNDAAPVLTAGQTAAFRSTPYRAEHVNLRDDEGNQLLGQQVSADSLPVVIASDQSVINTSDAANGPVSPGTAASKAELAAGQYNSTLPTLTTGQQAALQVNSSGELLVAQSSAATLAATVTQGPAASLSGAWPMEITDGTHGPAAVAPASTAAVATEAALVVALSPNSPLPAGSSNIGQVSIQSSNGSAFSNSNPLPVSIQDASPGTPIYYFNDNSAVAVNASVTNTYTITSSKNFFLYELLVSGSGKVKAVLQSTTGGGSPTLTTIGTFFNSTANPNIQIMFPSSSALELTGNGSEGIQVTVTNLDLAAADIYTTIIGQEQ